MHKKGSVLFLERFQERSPRINLCKTTKIKKFCSEMLFHTLVYIERFIYSVLYMPKKFS